MLLTRGVIALSLLPSPTPGPLSGKSGRWDSTFTACLLLLEMNITPITPLSPPRTLSICYISTMTDFFHYVNPLIDQCRIISAVGSRYHHYILCHLRLYIYIYIKFFNPDSIQDL